MHYKVIGYCNSRNSNGLLLVAFVLPVNSAEDSRQMQSPDLPVYGL